MTPIETKLMALYFEHWEAKPWTWEVHPMIRDGRVVWLRPWTRFGTPSIDEGRDGVMTDEERRIYLRMLRWMRADLIDEMADIALRIRRASH